MNFSIILRMGREPHKQWEITLNDSAMTFDRQSFLWPKCKLETTNLQLKPCQLLLNTLHICTELPMLWNTGIEKGDSANQAHGNTRSNTNVAKYGSVQK